MKKDQGYKISSCAFTIIFLITGIFLKALTVTAQNKISAKNIVIVHGAFADASGWEPVFNILKSRGYNVTMVQNPLTSLEADVAATKNAIDKQDGPVILVGHSWGGSVITQAGISPKVVGLVYVAAFVPAVGESTLDLVKSIPPAPENGILPPDEKGLIYYDKEKFHAGFAADVSAEKAAFMYSSQGPIAVGAFLSPITESAWKSKPSYAILAINDKSISPDLQRTMYKRAGSKVTEVGGSHVFFMSKPKIVAEVIMQAANESAR